MMLLRRVSPDDLVVARRTPRCVITSRTLAHATSICELPRGQIAEDADQHLGWQVCHRNALHLYVEVVWGSLREKKTSPKIWFALYKHKGGVV